MENNRGQPKCSAELRGTVGWLVHCVNASVCAYAGCVCVCFRIKDLYLPGNNLRKKVFGKNEETKYMEKKT